MTTPKSRPAKTRTRDQSTYPEAQAFSAELRKAMHSRQVRSQDLAASVGVSMTQVRLWRGGTNIPSHAYAVALSEALAWEALAQLSLDLRLARCQNDSCGRQFLRVRFGYSGRPHAYCSQNCRKIASMRKAQGRQARELTLAKRTADAALDAIADHCRDCAPEGICWNSGCKLRELSPFPYQDSVDVIPPPFGQRINPSRAIRLAVQATKRQHMRRVRAAADPV